VAFRQRRISVPKRCRETGSEIGRERGDNRGRGGNRGRRKREMRVRDGRE
jgi:hypothetical protein